MNNVFSNLYENAIALSDCGKKHNTYFHTIAFSLALYLARPFIQITCTPLVFNGVGMRTYRMNLMNSQCNLQVLYSFCSALTTIYYFNFFQ